MSREIFLFKDEAGRKFLIADWNGVEFYEITFPNKGETKYLMDHNGMEYELKRKEELCK